MFGTRLFFHMLLRRMDRWAELTLGIYLEPSFYEDILLYVNELTNVLEEVNQDFYSGGQGNFTIFSEHKMSPYVMKEVNDPRNEICFLVFFFNLGELRFAS